MFFETLLRTTYTQCDIIPSTQQIVVCCYINVLNLKCSKSYCMLCSGGTDLQLNKLLFTCFVWLVSLALNYLLPALRSKNVVLVLGLAQGQKQNIIIFIKVGILAKLLDWTASVSSNISKFSFLNNVAPPTFSECDTTVVHTNPRPATLVRHNVGVNYKQNSSPLNIVMCWQHINIPSICFTANYDELRRVYMTIFSVFLTTQLLWIWQTDQNL